jgi:hypothetical protein
MFVAPLTVLPANSDQDTAIRLFLDALHVEYKTAEETVWLTEFKTPWASEEGVWTEHLYQLGAFNYDWQEDVKLSPLTIFSKNDEKGIITEFLFQRECYERKDGKTVLRKDWFDIFKKSPSWAPLF